MPTSSKREPRTRDVWPSKTTLRTQGARVISIAWRFAGFFNFFASWRVCSKIPQCGIGVLNQSRNCAVESAWSSCLPCPAAGTPPGEHRGGELRFHFSKLFQHRLRFPEQFPGFDRNKPQISGVQNGARFVIHSPGLPEPDMLGGNAYWWRRLLDAAKAAHAPKLMSWRGQDSIPRCRRCWRRWSRARSSVCWNIPAVAAPRRLYARARPCPAPRFTLSWRAVRSPASRTWRSA
jgi:hypothetical protein